MAKKKNHYVDSKELEAHWSNWLDNDDQDSWNFLCEGVYKICEGVVVNFNPRDEDEHRELSHEAFVVTISKIQEGRLKSNGKSPVFNLLTTAIMRQLYSLKNRDSRHRRLYHKYKEKVVKQWPVEIRRTLPMSSPNPTA